MSQSEQFIVTDKNGAQGIIDASAAPPYDGKGTHVLVRLENDQTVVAPINALVPRKKQGYFLPYDLADLDAAPPPHAQKEQASQATQQDENYRVDEHLSQASDKSNLQRAAGGVAENKPTLVVPVVAEELKVEKRQVETGKVRISKRVREHEEIVDEPLMREEVHVERIPINRMVDGAVPIRYEGETMIVPILEEVMVVEKRLMLKEELHISKRQTEVHNPQRITLRAEEATIDRFNPQEEQEQSAAPTDKGKASTA
jgi:uncharacterized protein (TIGR02271 family)